MDCFKSDDVAEPNRGDGLASCSECGKEKPAYKCPKCILKYCSVICCNGHKSRCDQSANPSSVECKKEENSDQRKQKCVYNFPSEDTVPLEKLTEIKSDERVNQLLKSSQLRSLIKRLDEAPNPQTVFQDVMKNPEFRAFSNVILEITGVRSIDENNSD